MYLGKLVTCHANTDAVPRWLPKLEINIFFSLKGRKTAAMLQLDYESFLHDDSTKFTVFSFDFCGGFLSANKRDFHASQ